MTLSSPPFGNSRGPGCWDRYRLQGTLLWSDGVWILQEDCGEQGLKVRSLPGAVTRTESRFRYTVREVVFVKV